MKIDDKEPTTYEASGNGVIEDFSHRFGLQASMVKRVCDSSDNYRVYPRRKGNKTRWIEAPKPFLKQIQRQLLRSALAGFQPSPWCHGFCSGRSIFTHASIHTSRALVITMDLKDFFPTVSREMLTTLLAQYFNSPHEMELLMELITRRERLPQGAPTSPHLANLVFSSVDEQIACAIPAGWRYSRYADDLAFSGDDSPLEIVDIVTQLVEAAGFRVGCEKTRIMGQNRRQIVTGLVVNDGVRIPKPLRKKWRATLHRIRTQGMRAAEPSDPTALQGYGAYFAIAERFRSQNVG